MITTLLKAGADLKAQDKNGATALMYAAEYNQNPEVITTLLKAGADIKAQDKNGETPLMYAAALNQNPEVITTLLKAGADAKAKDSDGKTAFYYAQGNDALKGTDLIRQLQEQATDFFDLVQYGTPENVQAAIKKGADLRAENKGGMTPLMAAASFNTNPEVITHFLGRHQRW